MSNLFFCRFFGWWVTWEGDLKVGCVAGSTDDADVLCDGIALVHGLFDLLDDGFLLGRFECIGTEDGDDGHCFFEANPQEAILDEEAAGWDFGWCDVGLVSFGCADDCESFLVFALLFDEMTNGGALLLCAGLAGLFVIVLSVEGFGRVGGDDFDGAARAVEDGEEFPLNQGMW